MMQPTVRNPLALATLVVAAAFGIAACGSSRSSSGGGSGSGKAGPAATPAAEISRAAGTSSAAKGYTMRMSLNESVPGAGTVVVDLNGAMSASTKSGTMTETIKASGQTESIQEIVRGLVVYMKFPASTSAALGTDKPWLKLDFRKVANSPYLSSIAALENSSWENDPAQAFEYLRSETSHLTMFGSATVAGVQTTHYGGIANLRKSGVDAPASTRAAIKRVLRNLPGQIVNEKAMPIEVWVDGSNYVRKLQYEMQLIPKGSSQVIDAKATLVFTGYGPESTPSAPPAAETANLLTILKARGVSNVLGSS